ncbi:MAG: rhomboid family intramembrane serine protease [Bacteroidetes bacterium]|nr:MAG: rhomboid family intramembrane serine protease [Bacteroidota bacterium]
MQQFRPGGFTLLPPIVKNLLIINGLFYLATIAVGNSFGIDLYRVLGLHFPGAQNFAPYQFITYMFMHGSPTHLFFNMFALWMFGNVLENVWGPKRFVLYYIITGLGAALLHYAILYWQMLPTLRAVNEVLNNPDHESLKLFLESEYFKIGSQEINNNFRLFIRDYNSLINDAPNQAMVRAVNFLNQYKIDFLNLPVVVGASGAVFGILLAFGMLFPNSMIYLFFAIPIKAKYFVIAYGVMELYFGISRPGSNVAHFAHLGGMLFGYLLIRYWKSKGKLY